MQKLYPKSLKINEKSGMFQWVAILAFKKANIEKSFKNLDRGDKNQGSQKVSLQEKTKKHATKMVSTRVSS